MSDELKPCPFCGDIAHLEPAPTYGFPVAVCCPKCRTEGPARLTSKEAHAAWNTRADLWIPRELTLPEDGETVLVQFSDLEVFPAYYVEGDGWRHPGTREQVFRGYPILYWQHFPAPRPVIFRS